MKKNQNIDQNINQENKTFEEEIFDIMEKFLKSNSLSLNDLKSCKEICEQYENKIVAINLTNKLKNYCEENNYDINFDNKEESISVSYYESKILVCNNKKENYITLTFNFNNNVTTTFTYEITEEYSDNGKQKFTFNNLIMDGSLIFKKETNSLKNIFTNLSYIDEFIKENKIKISIMQLLNLILNLMDITSIFEKNINDIEANAKNEPKKFFKNYTWNSDSDVSLSDCE
jgi:hypothetical protein